MEVNGGTHLINGLLTEKPLLPRVIEFVKASADAGHSVTRDKHKEDADDEPPKPQFYLFSRERLVSLLHESSPRRVGRGVDYEILATLASSTACCKSSLTLVRFKTYCCQNGGLNHACHWAIGHSFFQFLSWQVLSQDATNLTKNRGEFRD